MSRWLSTAQTCSSSDCQDVSFREDGINSFEKRRQGAVLRSITIKAIWVSLHGAIVVGLMSANTALTWQWNNLSSLVHLTAYILLFAINCCFYLALCLANPGYLQKDVHALSTSTLQRDCQKKYADSEEVAELGIASLAHVDVSSAWRLGGRFSKGHPGTPDNASHSEQRGSWLASTQETQDKHDNTETDDLDLEEELMKPLVPGDLISRSVKKITVRTRGSSLGSTDEFLQSFKSHGDSDARNAFLNPELFSADAERRRSPERSSSDADRHDESICRLERRPSKPTSPMHTMSPSRRRHERQFSWWEGPNPGRWCEFCGAWQLLRSRHCHDCARCVRCFDHHCTWIGTCIGQDNHLMFWWYLLVQLTLLLWTLQINLDAFHLPIALTIGRLAILLGCLLPTLASTLFVASLLVYHSYLVATAQTTFEFMLGHSSSTGPARVPYLKHLPHDARPFSQGIIQNTIEFCCARRSKAYQMPAALSARRSVS